jgi:hypothetical protein
VNFNATYGSGFVTGHFGFDDVTIAGLAVKNVQVAAATAGFLPANDLFDGILGLAFAPLTSEHVGIDLLKDDSTTRTNYEPIILKTFKQNLTSPSFAFAPKRNGTDGFLSFGGPPPVPTVGRTAVTDILKVNFRDTPLHIRTEKSEYMWLMHCCYLVHQQAATKPS